MAVLGPVQGTTYARAREVHGQPALGDVRASSSWCSPTAATCSVAGSSTGSTTARPPTPWSGQPEGVTGSGRRRALRGQARQRPRDEWRRVTRDGDVPARQVRGSSATRPATAPRESTSSPRCGRSPGPPCWSTAAGCRPTTWGRRRSTPRPRRPARSPSSARSGPTPPVTRRRSPTAPPGRSPARPSAAAPGWTSTAASSTPRRRRPPRPSRWRTPSCPTSATARTSSTGCSGGSSGCWRCSASCYLGLGRARASSDGRRPREGSPQRARSIPPSTGSITPETKLAAGESRNAAARPNSSGRP